MKLNKAETALIEKVKSGDVVVTASFGYGKIEPRWNTLEYNAMVSLKNKGLLTFKRLGQYLYYRNAYSYQVELT